MSPPSQSVGPSAASDVDPPTVEAGAHSEPVARAPLRPGQRFGRYEIVDVLGAGGMGVVYRATDPQLEREVALKVLVPKPGDRWEDRSRLLREAKALARLNHPNVVAVYEVGEQDRELFIAMELVRGRDLRRWLHGDHAVAEVVAVFVAAGAGLAAAHQAGLVHRDFKPANVLVGKDGRPRVTDFGLARAPRLSHDSSSGSIDPRFSPSAASATSTTDLLLTADGTVVGTPAYMAPEQYEDTEPTARIDQYAFCVSLYEALLGNRPFLDKDADRLLAAKRRGPPPPPSGHRVPTHIVRAILRGLEPVAARRWPDMESLLAELSRDPAARRRRIFGTLGVIGVGIAMIAFASRDPSAPDPCPADPQALAGVWDEDVRARVQVAFLATERSYAAATFERLAARLDEWALRWDASKADACQATRVRGVQSEAMMDRRMACLADRRAAVAAVTAVLVDPDAEVVDRAPRLADALLAPETCDDATTVDRTMPDPTVVTHPQDVANLRSQLAAVTVLVELGRFAEARANLHELVAAADRTEFAPLVAEVHVSLGHVLDSLAEPTAAEEELERAVWLAYDDGYDRMVAVGALRLTWNVGVSQSRSEPALVWARLAEAALDRTTDDPMLRAQLLNTKGAVLQGQNDLAAAATAFERALAIVRKHGGADHIMLAGAMANLAIVRSDELRYDQALALQQRALEIREAVQGRDHPDTAGLLNNMSTVLLALEREDEALERNREALRRLEATLGNSHPLYATALVQRSLLEHEAGRTSDAATTLATAAAIMERTRGSTHADLAVVYTNLGYVYDTLDRHEDARDAFSRALGIHEANGTREGAAALATEVGYARSLRDLGQLDAATTRFEAILARIRDGQPCPPHTLSDAYLGAVSVARARGDDDTAAAREAERKRRLTDLGVQAD